MSAFSLMLGVQTLGPQGHRGGTGAVLGPLGLTRIGGGACLSPPLPPHVQHFRGVGLNAGPADFSILLICQPSCSWRVQVRVKVRLRFRLSACCPGSDHVTALWLCCHGDVVEEADRSRKQRAIAQ